MKNILRQIEQYVVPALLLFTGIAAVLFYGQAEGLETQPTEMLLGGLCLIGAGLLMTPIFNSFLKKGVSIALFVLLSLGAAALGYKVYDVIASETTHREAKENADKDTIQRLKDLRLAFETYRSYNGAYTDNYDTLTAFLKSKVVPVPYRNGNVMENKFFQRNPEEMKRRDEYIISRAQLADLGLTEAQAVKQHYEVRDTTYITPEEKFFSDKVRERKKLPPVNIAELSFNPWNDKRFILDSDKQDSSMVAKGQVQKVYIKVTDPEPYKIDQENKVTNFQFSFGSTDQENLDGNWKE